MNDTLIPTEPATHKLSLMHKIVEIEQAFGQSRVVVSGLDHRNRRFGGELNSIRGPQWVINDDDELRFITPCTVLDLNYTTSDKMNSVSSIA